MILRILASLTSFALLAGCASVDRIPAFADLAKTVHLRTGKRVQWNRGGPADAQAQQAVIS